MWLLLLGDLISMLRNNESFLLFGCIDQCRTMKENEQAEKFMILLCALAFEYTKTLLILFKRTKKEKKNSIIVLKH